MNLIRFIEPVTVQFKKSSGSATLTFEASRDYVIAQAQFDRLMGDENVRKRVYKMSRLDPRIENFHVQARKATGRRLLFYNGSGGFGDQIMSWPVARILSTMGFEVHVMTEPGNTFCWWHFPFIKGTDIIPMPYEHFKMFDHVCCFEQVVNMDEHPDQEHPVDAMLRKIGIDPNGVAPELKSVGPLFTGSELAAADRQFQGQKIAFFQLSSANSVRALPPNDAVYMAMKIAEAFPDWHWLCLHDEFIPKEYSQVLEDRITKKGLTNVQSYRAPQLRELWALTRRAEVVVAPDSMMPHLCGVMSVPCVGLWGPVSPGQRVKYYKNHWPIYHREFCPQSPCFAYTSTFPKYCPPRAERKVCELLAGIRPQEVIEKIREIETLKETSARARSAEPESAKTVVPNT